MPNINQIFATTEAMNCSRGAPMGRSTDKEGIEHPLYLQRVTFVDYCYDRGGAYWGLPQNLWCAFNEEGTRLFTRASTRHEAAENLRANHDGITFKRAA
ncbi:MAG: hypothetical protein JSS66_05720 [Armatimonadetes bacterium]|nr:hypothetical protein [Armatimonadota bacterium]